MLIPALTIDQDGPGIDLSDQPEGYLLNMSDPVADFEYARNAVTLNCDLSGVEHVRLLFKALEYGDEPHSPPAATFGHDATPPRCRTKRSRRASIAGHEPMLCKYRL